MDKFIDRALAPYIQEISQDFRVLLLSGPRQVGKTTLLRSLDHKRDYISFDDLTIRTVAQNDPAAFVNRLSLPVLIDEVQYVPEIFPYIKLRVDNLSEKGQFWLTGSQQFSMMKNITESLAGRIVILNLQGFSLAEECHDLTAPPFLPSPEVLTRRSNRKISSKDLWYKIWRGSFPDIVMTNGRHWEHFYSSYVTTYIQRDIREYLNVNDLSLFHKFMQVIAARTGQMINYAEIARTIGVSEKTIKAWISALEASGIIYQLSSYSTNATKRALKTPKLYFMDTGLCSYLAGWLNADTLERGAMNGAILETYVISEVIKSYLNVGRISDLYYYRDKDQNEIDLMIIENGEIYPIEIKKHSLPNFQKIEKTFKLLEKLGMPVKYSGIVCYTDKLVPVSETMTLIPISYV